MKATADALEAKRLIQGLGIRQTFTALGVAERTYYLLRHRPDHQLKLDTCADIAEWLQVSAEEILRMEGYWDRLSLLGRVMAPAMIRAYLTSDTLALATGTSIRTISDAVWGKRVPNKDWLAKWASVLELDVLDLIQARREMLELRKPHPLGGHPKRILTSQGRAGLRRTGEQLNKRLERRLRGEGIAVSDGQDILRSRDDLLHGLATPARAERFATWTEREQLRWSLARLQPYPRGRFGLCRVCDKLTFMPGSALALDKRNLRVELHQICWSKWRAESEDYADWQTRRHRDSQHAGPMPLPSYSEGRRLNAQEIAEYYATTVEYLHIRERIWGAVRRPGSNPETVTDLAVSLKLGRKSDGSARPRNARSRLFERIEWVIDKLPNPEICNAHWAKKVRVLAAFLKRPRNGPSLAYLPQP